MLKKWFLGGLLGLVALSGSWQGYSKVYGAECAANCPFCSAASQTLRQESLSMDAVAIATLQSDGRLDIDGNATFVVERVLRGETLLEKGQKVEANYFGPGKTDKKFLLLGVDPRNLVWSSPLPLSKDAEKYIDAIQKLPEDPVERLDFYQKHFEHPDSLLARDSYDEFALAPYEDVKKLKPKMDREQLMDWVRDPAISPDRKRLYYTMLGICGTEADAVEFESMIRSNDPDKRAGLDALIAAYLMLRGAEGLPLINEQFLANRKATYPDVYSSVMALRFHGTEAERLPKEAILASMRHLLEAPDLADLVIPDLARWGDWSQIDRLSELFKKANDDNSWVRVPVVNYLRACPLPEAKERLAELEKIDPKAVKRAATFFPIPAPGGSKDGDGKSGEKDKKDGKPAPAAPNSSSSWIPVVPMGPESGQGMRGTSRLARVERFSGNRLVSGWRLEGAKLVAFDSLELGESVRRESISGGLALGDQVLASGASFVREASVASAQDKFGVNSWIVLSVILLNGVAFGAFLWMVLTGMFSKEHWVLRRVFLPRS